MGFHAGDWVLGCKCVKCGRACAVLPDKGGGEGSAQSAVQGAFYCRREHCGACNAVHTAELGRFQLGAKRGQAA